MNNSLLTIVGIATAGLIKYKLGSSAVSKILSKQFDAFEFCPTIWFDSPFIEHYVEIPIDGILGVKLMPGEDLDGTGDRMFVAHVIIDPEGPLADWRTNVQTRIHLNHISNHESLIEDLLNIEISKIPGVEDLFFEWAGLGDDTGISFTSEEWQPYELTDRPQYHEGEADIGFMKEKLLVFENGSPIFMPIKSRKSKLRRR